VPYDAFGSTNRTVLSVFITSISQQGIELFKRSSSPALTEVIFCHESEADKVGLVAL